MATEGPAREIISVAMYPAGKEWFEEMAHKHRLTRSEAIRAGLVVARRHAEEVDEALKLMAEIKHG